MWTSTVLEEEEEFYKLLPANKADRLCQPWQSCSDLHKIQAVYVVVDYKLLLLLLSYGTMLAVERQTWCGTAPTRRETMTHLYGALGDTTYSRDETDTGC